MVWISSCRLVRKLFRAMRAPASSNFSLRKRKNSAMAISGKQRGLWVVFLPTTGVRRWWSWVVVLPRKPALGQQYGTFRLENQQGCGQSFFDGSAVDGFTA
jgi:hypothetical protein